MRPFVQFTQCHKFISMQLGESTINSFGIETSMTIEEATDLRNSINELLEMYKTFKMKEED